jgi:hypothetical protein
MTTTTGAIYFLSSRVLFIDTDPEAPGVTWLVQTINA